MDKKTGKVFLIGAGPGDPELITMKALRIIKKADCIIYDSLVTPFLLDHARVQSEKIFVGKRAGLHSKKQAEINKILVEKAGEYHSIVRLKGGDPLVFGRGGEEIETLIEHQIEYEVIPGITSALAVPAYAGIPVTHRDMSRSFAVVTGHLKAGEPIENLHIPDADTLVFVMGISNLEELVTKLLKTGDFNSNTPAALIKEGTLPTQREVYGTLSSIVRLRDKESITPPAIFIVGNVVSLGKKMSWKQNLPLFGKRVVILRTLEQSGELSEKLMEKGAYVIKFPVISIVPVESEIRKIDKSFLELFTTILFTSPNGVEIFFGALHSKSLDSRLLFGKKIFAIGKKTAEYLLQYGIKADGIPQKFIAEGLLEIIPRDMRNENILIPRASEAREILPEELRKRGAHVTVLKIYRTETAKIDSVPVQDGDYVVFTSSSTVKKFYGIEDCANKRITAFCLGEITASELRKRIDSEIVVSPNASIDDLVETIINFSYP